MSRLSPWVVRRDFLPGTGRASAALSAAVQGARPSQLADDVRLFLTGWAGGLVFFGTLLG